MHLLAAESGRIDDGETAVDFDQSPADIVILSAADSELSALMDAFRRENFGVTLRLANLGKLAHPLSVDLYVDKTLARSKVVIVRMMGGAGYWPYGLDRLRALSRGGGPALIVVPGEDRWDETLEAYSTVSGEIARSMWRYLVEGGPRNTSRALQLAAHCLGQAPPPEPPEIIPHAGFYWPCEGPSTLENIRPRPRSGRPVAPVVFYRAYVQSGATAVIDALCKELLGAGIDPLPVFVTSLKDRESESFLDAAFAAFPPDIVLNTTAFSVSQIGGGKTGTVLDRPGRPVLQLVLAGTTEANWRDSARGLTPRDLTMNVVLPEVDGRTFTRAIGFKAETKGPAGTQAEHRPLPDRIAFAVRQAKAWIDLARRPADERRVAIVLSNYPNRDGRIGNGVGLDTPESAVVLSEALRAADYDMPGFTASSRELMDRLLDGVTNDLSRSPRSSSRRKPGSITHSAMDSGFRRNDDEVRLAIQDYRAFFATLPEANRTALTERWGEPDRDPFFADAAFHLAIHRFGNVVVGIQPSRGYDIDPKATYHAPDLVPPHHYLAFYAWLRNEFGADAIVHLGKHGNLEWLPGKALGLSDACWPEAILGAVPVIYPFIVNDPGEGAQAKRRSSAVIVDHLIPAMTRAEIHGGLAELETLIDEYYLAAGIDRHRRDYLRGEIIAAAERHGLDRDLGIGRADGDEALRALDAHLCELKEMQIRDGLHVLGRSPEGRLRIDTLVAIARVPRSGGRAEDQSLHRAIAADLGLAGFDPLDCDPASEWIGPRPEVLAGTSDVPWRSNGDTVERIELVAMRLVEESLTPRSVIPAKAGIHPSVPREGSLDSGSRRNDDRGEAGDRDPLIESRRLYPFSDEHGHLNLPLEGRSKSSTTISGGGLERKLSDPLPTFAVASLREVRPPPKGEVQGEYVAASAVLAWIASDLAPALDRSGNAEIAAVLTALDGRFVPPGPSGAPTRGRSDVLPTGRNFYSVDVRAVPTAAAWALGRQAADALALRYFQDEGAWPRSIAMSAWGTSNMRTGGDDIAQVFALIGAKPVWEKGTGRVTGFTVIPLSELGRPRIDVTLRISGMFRDAFPVQIDLIDSAMRAVAALEEPDDANPIAAAARDAKQRLAAASGDPEQALRLAMTRIFGAKPGAYGAGLQAMIDEGIWTKRGDLADTFLAWSSFAYGGGAEGETTRALLEERLAAADAVFHAQDNREHDILDSDDYYQFQGGLAATVETLKGVAPRVYHGDHSRPEKPVVRALSEEIARVVRGRAANPKWIAGVMRHGYKGAFEIAATVDYLFAYAATTNAVQDHHFDQLFEAYIGDERVRAFIAENNAPALAEMAARFREAIERGLWAPRANSAYDRLSALIAEARQEAAE
jgi:cobaltochelatase CobN